MQLRRRNILSIYNGPEGLARGKGRKTVSRAGARRLGQLSSPDVLAPVRHLRTPSLVRHLRTPIILTECTALARTLEEASRRNTTPERVTIFTDAQVAVRRIASDEPGCGQQYALQARKHIATLHRARPGIIIEIRWCLAHNGVDGNEKADEWAKIAAGARHPRRGMAELLRPDGSAGNASSTVPRQPQAGDFGEEVGGGATTGRRPDLQEETQTGRKPQARQHGRCEHQEARPEVLPGSS